MRQVFTSLIVSFGLAGSVLTGGCSSAGTTAEDAGSSLADAAPSPTDAAPAVPNADCDALCAKVSALACSAAGSCKADCQKQIAQTPSQCSAEVLALIACSANEGKVVACDSKGKGRVEGCNTQLSTYANCLLGGGGGGGDGGAPRCGEITTGDTACDQCMDKSCCDEESACAGSPDCIAFDACITKGTARATCESDHPRGRDLSAASASCLARSCRASCP